MLAFGQAAEEVGHAAGGQQGEGVLLDGVDADGQDDVVGAFVMGFGLDGFFELVGQDTDQLAAEGCGALADVFGGDVEAFLLEVGDDQDARAEPQGHFGVDAAHGAGADDDGDAAGQEAQLRLAFGVRAVFEQVVVTLLGGVDATDRLGHGGGKIRHLVIRQGQEAVGLEDLFLHDDVLGQMAAEGVADGAFVHVFDVAVTLAEVDRVGIDGGLNGESLARGVFGFEVVADLDECDGAFVAEDDGPFFHVPAADEGVVRALVDELEDAGADAGGIDTGQKLVGVDLGNGDLGHF